MENWILLWSELGQRQVARIPNAMNMCPLRQNTSQTTFPTASFNIHKMKLTLAVVQLLRRDLVFGALQLDGLGHLGVIVRQRNHLQMFAVYLKVRGKTKQIITPSQVIIKNCISRICFFHKSTILYHVNSLSTWFFFFFFFLRFTCCRVRLYLGFAFAVLPARLPWSLPCYLLQTLLACLPV